MVDLHTNEVLSRTRMLEDAQRAAQYRRRRGAKATDGRVLLARALRAAADRLAPSRRTRHPAYELERAA